MIYIGETNDLTLDPFAYEDLKTAYEKAAKNSDEEFQWYYDGHQLTLNTENIKELLDAVAFALAAKENPELNHLK
jgi:hypothetical protein